MATNASKLAAILYKLLNFHFRTAFIYQLTSDEFRILFKNSAVKRTKFKGLKRNIDTVRKSMDESSDSC